MEDRSDTNRGGSLEGKSHAEGSVLDRKRPVPRIPTSFSSHIGQRSGPLPCGGDDDTRSATDAGSASAREGEGGTAPRRQCDPPGRLSTSFSANLGRKISTPSSGKASGNQSVRAIVAWLESSTNNPGATTPSTGETPVEKTPATPQKQIKPALTESPSVYSQYSHQPTPQTLGQGQPDNYSLSMLRYQRYFNNRPLAQCLDEHEPPSPTPKVLNTYGELTIHSEAKNNIEKARQALTQELEEEGGIKEEAVTVSEVPDTGINPGRTPDAELKADIAKSDGDQMRNRQHPKGCGIATTEIAQDRSQPTDNSIYRRDPVEVAAFWNNVREYLWVTDDEVEARATETEVQKCLEHALREEKVQADAQAAHASLYGTSIATRTSLFPTIRGQPTRGPFTNVEFEPSPLREVAPSTRPEANGATNGENHGEDHGSRWVMVEAPRKWSYNSVKQTFHQTGGKRLQSSISTVIPQYPTPGRRRVLSTDEKLHEIDVFLAGGLEKENTSLPALIVLPVPPCPTRPPPEVPRSRRRFERVETAPPSFGGPAGSGNWI